MSLSSIVTDIKNDVKIVVKDVESGIVTIETTLNKDASAAAPIIKGMAGILGEIKTLLPAADQAALTKVLETALADIATVAIPGLNTAAIANIIQLVVTEL